MEACAKVEVYLMEHDAHQAIFLNTKVNGYTNCRISVTSLAEMDEINPSSPEKVTTFDFNAQVIALNMKLKNWLESVKNDDINFFLFKKIFLHENSTQHKKILTLKDLFESFLNLINRMH